jgi:hypothetical protein
MSIRVTSWVWENTRAEGAELLVLLALAEHAGNDGSCYPSMRRIAERARLSLRGAQTAMRALEAKGAISTSRNTGPHGCNRYTVLMHATDSVPRAETAPSADTEPSAHAASGADAAPRTEYAPPQMTTSTPADNDMGGANGGMKPPQHLHPNRKEPLLKPLENLRLTPAQLGKEVQQRCQLSDPSGRLGLCLTEQCRFAQKDAQASDEQIAERMSSAWLLLQSSGHKLEYAWGAEKFFGEGRWKNSAAWPWKQGMAPQPEFRPIRAIDKLRRNEAYFAGTDSGVPQSGDSWRDAA